MTDTPAEAVVAAAGWAPNTVQIVTFVYGASLLLHVVHLFFFSPNTGINHTHIVIDLAMWLMFPCTVLHYFIPLTSLFLIGCTMVYLVIHFWKIERQRVIAGWTVVALVVVWNDYKAHAVKIT